MHTTHYGKESIANLGEKIWGMIPQDIKEEKSISSFKNKVNKWIPENCPCRLCKIYLAQVGFI